jgi:hypothetical protein
MTGVRRPGRDDVAASREADRWVGLASGLLTGAGVAGPGAAAVRAAAVWGTAKQVPGSNALNQGGRADITSVSCASAANCSAGGSYASGLGGNGKPNSQALVVTESGGRWGTAREVPGTGGLNAGGSAQIDSISCSAPGDCGAGGSYTDASGHVQAFVATPDRRHLAQRAGGPRHRRARPGQPRRRGPVGLVCRGGRLRRGRVLHRRLRPAAGLRRDRDRRHLA